MTEERLKEIEARREAASQGPYSFHTDKVFAGEIRNANFTHIANEVDGNDATGEFLASSWQDIGDLLAEVKRLQQTKKYIRHTTECEYCWHESGCSCGLDAVRAALAGEGKTEEQG